MAALVPGEVSEVIEDQGALYILRLEERREAGLRDFEEIRDLIQRLVASEKRVRQQRQWFEGLLREAHIVRYLGDGAPGTGEGGPDGAPQ